MTREETQGRMPFGASEAHHQENLELLQKLAKKIRLPAKELAFLRWLENIDYRYSTPLKATFHEIGSYERGIACSRATAIRVVSRLRSLGLISVRKVVTPAGQKPNEYRLDWAAIGRAWRTALSSESDDEPEYQNESARVSDCDSPSIKMSRPESHSDTHIEEQPVLNPPVEIHPERTRCAEGPGRSGSGRGFFVLSEGDWPAVCRTAREITSAMGKSRPGKLNEDRELAFKVAWLLHLGELPEAVTAEALQVLKDGRLKGEKIRCNAAAYRGVLVHQAAKFSIQLHELLERVPVPEWAERIVYLPALSNRA